MYLLGIDLGSSSVKVSLLNEQTNQIVGTAQYPNQEMVIKAVKTGWAEQSPNMWWDNMVLAAKKLFGEQSINPKDVIAIGISYQMHGLVALDKNGDCVRDSIIWCDSRAAQIGAQAFNDLGQDHCLKHILNSPGNFTFSKLAWVKNNEPELYKQIDKVMLPGDYIAYRLSGEKQTTVSGLSEGMAWNFQESNLWAPLMNYYGLDTSMVSDIVDTFSVQAKVCEKAANELGIAEGTPITYRAGDQPNNALSLNVLNPGEVAATAGTSGVVYGVSDKIDYDPKSRVNMVAHVNHTKVDPRLGILLCINGTGILNSWLHKQVCGNAVSYAEMNRMAESVPIGSDGLLMLPFGNGAERMLNDSETHAQLYGLNFNRHTQAHMLRAAQEGIVFAFQYGIEIMNEIGMDASLIRAGHANMFQSSIFRDTLATLSEATIELYNTDGSAGAARGAGIGVGAFGADTAFGGLKCIHKTEPNTDNTQIKENYNKWKQLLQREL